MERYHRREPATPWRGLVRSAYYTVRPWLPVPLRKPLQRARLSRWKRIRFPSWPVNVTVEQILERELRELLQAQGKDSTPFIWFWPEGYDSCAMVTHDVEGPSGRNACSALMDLDDSFGVKSAFGIIPRGRYRVTPEFLQSITQRGFEVAVHDLSHDGSLFRDKASFDRQVEEINRYGRQFGARGFRGGTMYRNQEWYGALEFEYDMSVPNVAHLEPQRGGCCTVFPYFNGQLLELPLTTTQDYALFHFIGDYSTDLWRQQIALIRQQHGLITILVHPDYAGERRAREIYVELLHELVELRQRHGLWLAMPGEVNAWWRLRSKLKLVFDAGAWRIEGEGAERARVAYAKPGKDGKIVYELAAKCRAGAMGGQANTVEHSAGL